MARIGVVGVGSIGTVLARGFDELGHDVRINDINPQRRHGSTFTAWSKSRMARQCDVVIVAVPTPTDEHGGDPSAVEAAVAPFAELETDAAVVIRSTMPPGTTAALARETDLPLVYSPEFLRDRSDVSDFFDPDRIVIAGPEPERACFGRLLEDDRVDCERVIELDDYLTAELAKDAHNAFFAAKVSFANQMRAIAESSGADPETLMEIVTADSRNTTSHLDPMLGPFGGKCLPKDTAALEHFARVEAGVPTPLLRATLEMNEVASDAFDELDIAGSWPDVRVKSD
jgi:UDPglucose 6-dehydrogenase